MLVGTENGIATLQKSLVVSLQLNIYLPYDPAIKLLRIYLRNENLCSHKKVYTNATAALNCQNPEITQLSFNW